jgi:membrane associated rhomboid family serine protease
MFVCPICHVSLSKAQNDIGIFWTCPSCRGRAATVSLLRKGLARDAVNALWLGARSASAPKRRDCPACLARMAEVSLPAALSAQTIDVCTCCQTVWFDTHEYERMPPAPPSKAPKPLPPETRQRLAVLEVKALHEIYAKEARAPDEAWKFIPAIFGLPFEHTSRVRSQLPWVTWGLTAAVVAASLAAFAGGEEAFQRFGLVPAKLAQSGGLTLFTSVFLHGGWAHLLSNMYFLVVFGDNVEDLLGKARYALLLLLAALAGGLAHVLADVSSTTPCVGASGFISGILAYYALALPQARLGWMFRWWAWIKWVNLSARNMFLLWCALQLVGVWKQIAGFSNISALAHLGGVAAGALFWAIGRYDAARSSSPYAHNLL